MTNMQCVFQMSITHSLTFHPKRNIGGVVGNHCTKLYKKILKSTVVPSWQVTTIYNLINWYICQIGQQWLTFDTLSIFNASAISLEDFYAVFDAVFKYFHIAVLVLSPKRSQYHFHHCEEHMLICVTNAVQQRMQHDAYFGRQVDI